MSNHNEEQEIGRMSAEALRRHLEDLIGVDVSLSEDDWAEADSRGPLAADYGVAESGTAEHKSAEHKSAEQGAAEQEQPLVWTLFRLTGSVRGSIRIGARSAVIAQMLQLAMSEPVDTAATGNAEAALHPRTSEAWRGLLADALRPMAEELRGSLGWDAALALCDPASGDPAAVDAAAGDADAADAAGAATIQRLRMQSGDLRLPLRVRTQLDLEGGAGPGAAASADNRAAASLGARAAVSVSGGGTASAERRFAQPDGRAGGHAGDGSQSQADLPNAFAESPGLAENPSLMESRGMELLMDIELEATLRFGSRELSLQEVLSLGPGGVIELDRHVSEPVDLVVADKIVARGEVVMINGNFGLRVTEVAAPQLRLESIRCLF
ncbi:MAG: FliM/FliN family flagellar motor switch protein [Acidobacteriaceae bacterium]